MTRSYTAILLIFLASSAPGCSRPSEGDCKKAISNIRLLAGTESDDFGDPETAIRSCRGNASKESVKCVIGARTPADLEKCEGGLFDEMFKEEIENSKKDEAKPDVAKPDVAKPDVAKPDEAKPDEAKPDEAKPDEAKPDEAKPPVATPPT